MIDTESTLSIEVSIRMSIHPDRSHIIKVKAKSAKSGRPLLD